MHDIHASTSHIQISKSTIFTIHIRNLKIVFIKVVETSLFDNSPSHKDEQILFFVTKTVLVFYAQNSLTFANTVVPQVVMQT